MRDLRNSACECSEFPLLVLTGSERGSRGGARFAAQVADGAGTLIEDRGCSSARKLAARVLTATDGTDALGVYAQYRDRIALVLTDMMMPYMDGAATIRAPAGPRAA